MPEASVDEGIGDLGFETAEDGGVDLGVEEDFLPAEGDEEVDQGFKLGLREGKSGGDQGVLDPVMGIDELLVLEEDLGGALEVALGDEEEGEVKRERRERADFLLENLLLDGEGMPGIFQEIQELFVLEETGDFLQAGLPAREIPGLPGQIKDRLSVAFSGVELGHGVRSVDFFTERAFLEGLADDPEMLFLVQGFVDDLLGGQQGDPRKFPAEVVDHLVLIPF